VSATDQARSIQLCELALEFARAHLKPQGAFLVKVFQGTGYPAFLAAMRGVFVAVASRKPGASRCDSKEMYLVGKELKAHWSLSLLGLRMEGMRFVAGKEAR